MNRQFSSYEIRLGGKNISILADACDLARALELTQYFPQCNPLAGGQVKFATDVDLVKRSVIFPRHERQNLFSNITSFAVISAKQYGQVYRVNASSTAGLTMRKAIVA